VSAAAFLALLEAGDVDALRDVWAKVAPHLPQPDTREKAEIVMHMARTSSTQVHFRRRAYSHSWLTERSLPSQLPDELKPRAERMYPRIVEGVGIAIKARNPLFQPVADEARKAMEHAVLDAEAEGKLSDGQFVTERMNEARDRTYRSLLGG
jgi:hypothetical protein